MNVFVLGLVVIAVLAALLLAFWYYSRRNQDYQVESISPDGEELIMGERLERPPLNPDQPGGVPDFMREDAHPEAGPHDRA